MFAAYTILPINYVLHRESWARKWLQSYEGKSVRIRIPPLVDLKMVVLANGEFGYSSDNHEADATLSCLPSVLPGLIAHDESAYDAIDIAGNVMFAEDLITISKSLKPDIEQELSKFIGDIPAHRLAKAGESLFQWHINLVKNLSDTLGEYWSEEQPIVAKPGDLRRFFRQTEVVRNNLDQLEIRINHLIQKSSI
ncbi:MAG: ubiquinone biosynthesis protein [Nitrosomonas sp.]|nr:ubiquinone biosynthesis protein [Nitrosomonas sp.]MCW5606803.1 ubiquinone biosynthesis protein [Nitrosomonas sp.]